MGGNGVSKKENGVLAAQNGTEYRCTSNMESQAVGLQGQRMNVSQWRLVKLDGSGAVLMAACQTGRFWCGVDLRR